MEPIILVDTNRSSRLNNDKQRDFPSHDYHTQNSGISQCF